MIQEKIFYKSINNPICIDLFITNHPNNFQNTLNLILNNFSLDDFKTELNQNLGGSSSNYENFEQLLFY